MIYNTRHKFVPFPYVIFWASMSLCSMLTAVAQSAMGQGDNQTHDIGWNLEDVLQRKRVAEACPEYFSLLDKNDVPFSTLDPIDVQRKETLCGKWLFFSWEARGAFAIPEVLLQALPLAWPDRVGRDYSKLGFYPDPKDPQRLPIGLVRSSRKYLGLPARNVTCAGCHFGRLPDGRYAVGAQNDRLDLSLFNLMSYYPIFLAMTDEERQRDLPIAALERFQQLQSEEEQNLAKSGLHPLVRGLLGFSRMLRITGKGTRGFPDREYVQMPPKADLGSWVEGRPGIYNPAAPMLTLQVRPLPQVTAPTLWGVRGDREAIASGHEAPVGQISKYRSLEDFVASAIIYGFQEPDLVRPRYVRPLVRYLRQLKAPKPVNSMTTSETRSFEEGERLFSGLCQGCHNGPSGESSTLYAPASLGVSDSYGAALQNYRAETPLARFILSIAGPLNALLDPQPLGVKARRLNGAPVQRLYLSDGSVSSLEELFCLKQRSSRAIVHLDLCHADEVSRRNLVVYLRNRVWPEETM